MSPQAITRRSTHASTQTRGARFLQLLRVHRRTHAQDREPGLQCTMRAASEHATLLVQLRCRRGHAQSMELLIGGGVNRTPVGPAPDHQRGRLQLKLALTTSFTLSADHAMPVLLDFLCPSAPDLRDLGAGRLFFTNTPTVDPPALFLVRETWSGITSFHETPHSTLATVFADARNHILRLNRGYSHNETLCGPYPPQTKYIQIGQEID
ncbi:hypothetical protein BD779DRAFT_1707554 [Infundibulicybe gibba]|nr:hypothetical protein BD779DRAFT_1707554 [Infundibulicybe gibba]